MRNSHHTEILEEVWNAITHGLGVFLAAAGMVLLLLRTTSPLEAVSVAIYGSSLILLFLFSTLRHALHFTGAASVFRVLDHSGIYLLIAGTYTPYCLVSVKGWIGWSVLGLIWTCAILGIVFTSIFLRGGKKSRLSTVLFVVMGWTILLAIWPIYVALGTVGFGLLIAGGLVYSLGAVVYHFKFPYAHVWWHLFVMVAAFLMWLSIYSFVI